MSLPSPDAPAGERPVVVGLYGLPGSGKSFLLNQLKQQLNHDEFVFHEGSEKLASITPGGLDQFRMEDDLSKAALRASAIDEIRQESVSSGRTAIVTGHLMFWGEGQHDGEPVYTPQDLSTYTHILYLGVDAEVLARQRENDEQRERDSASIKHLRRWQDTEITSLRHLCHNHGILFCVLHHQSGLPSRVAGWIRHFRQDTAKANWNHVQARLDEVLGHRDGLQTALVLDADKTLAAQDTGALFWQALAHSQPDLMIRDSPLGDLFGGPLGYSECAFRQATLLYEQVATDEEYETLCETVAGRVDMYHDFRSLLGLAASQKHVAAIVVTCGLRRVWEMVLEREGLSETVKVVGGGRISDKFVINAELKAEVVSRLRNIGNLHIWAFGDSPLDLPMLKAADEAIVVVGLEKTRSRSMDAALLEAMNSGHLQARQVLLPGHVRPRLDYAKLPRVHLADEALIESAIRHRSECLHPGFEMLHATDKKAAKLLMSPMRDASVAGPLLRKAHHDAGRYLAIEYLSECIGVEEYSMPHVQGSRTNGHRLCHEEQTSIVALMRGGEPMAFGINQVFPRAMFIHASSASDIKPHHLQHQRTVVLVDSVVNSGKSVMEFVEHVLLLNSSIRIVVVAGVVQAEAVSRGHALASLLRRCDVKLIALRLSGNKYTGTKTTDTGNRLFNTTHML